MDWTVQQTDGKTDFVHYVGNVGNTADSVIGPLHLQ